jgi:uncharacterized membrane protein YcaP (DUF421 family)
MPPEELRLSDWKRLLLGKAPFSFLAELVVRVIVLYALALVLGRLLGKRMSGQVSTLELSIIVLLGAVLGPPFQMPEQGLLPAALLLFSLLALHQVLIMMGARSPRFEHLTQNRATIILRDGRLLPDELRRVGISNQQLFAALRASSVRQLGELKRIYMEAWGEFSLFRAEPSKPGLSTEPESDLALRQRQWRVPECVACARCGFVVERKALPGECEHCHADVWVDAVKSDS